MQVYTKRGGSSQLPPLLVLIYTYFCSVDFRYQNYQHVYTYGSKEDLKVGCAVISDNHGNMQRIPDASSIFTAKEKAVDLALT